MNRRNFITLFSVSLLASCSPILFAASYAAKPKPKKQPSKSNNWINVGTVEELNKTGQILQDKSPLGAILVVKSGEKLTAVNPTCTHLGCIVDWEKKENIFLCPCHDSEFAPDGKYRSGPAPESLAKYEVKTTNGKVMVRSA
ncbi:MAG: Rieske 2Fe-2S domain-containing protein [Calothrix sp. MO_167.B12]|nr:Rieske 2Fe-2S domain-containing protein [Calothrix sp. MO_167.B12]